jgi:hypothetical protein
MSSVNEVTVSCGDEVTTVTSGDTVTAVIRPLTPETTLSDDECIDDTTKPCWECKNGSSEGCLSCHGWSQCYHELNKCFCTVAGAEYPCGYYFQTFGGGPEGGYVVSLDMETAWSVERSWHSPFKMEELSSSQKLIARIGEVDVEVALSGISKEHEVEDIVERCELEHC